ncbi:nicotinamide phosphoribosyltransferase domain-containing protein [Bacillus methanolicus]|uniref:Nicotinamide phosphoribosyltransferase n=1 Tax=Bacillus methanolicus (strain MGA3 / ATCC 53907) TaxID=796606 RepID=I3E8V9_BACMM|nr:nicotinamide phosphoribosyltransferase domain-containing protein [Bacillus methanolicus]AIE60195.1 putative nicotinate phosphoribosyltransferase [Bacillus methanolicus MGA3]EIJ82930.1 putative nicotinate phosphoribosyltransferase [Bacillus methanolicus MGA3]
MLKDIYRNPVVLTDSYNPSHHRLKINGDWEISHIYNRKAGMILYGLREIVNSILSIQITKEHVIEAERHAKRMGMVFPTELFMRVVEEFNGYAPISIETLPEGTWCPIGTPFAQIRNTVEGFGELVTWWEANYLHGYFPSNCATEAFHIRKYLEEKKELYGFDDSFFWRVHSYGFRAHRSLEDAYWAGTAWNLTLHETDDFHTSIHNPHAVIGGVSAQSHKVTQQFDNEYDSFIHAIDVTYEDGLKFVALLIDTYDAYRVIHEYLPSLGRYAKEKGIKIAMRPDSGDVIDQAIQIYKVAKANDLLDTVSAFIGDGMSFEVMKKYDAILEEHGIPLNFVAYGIGAGFYQHMTRDTLSWAMKTAYSNGKDRMKFGMEPIKRSIPGEVKVVKIADDLVVETVDESERESLYEVIYHHDGTEKTPTIKIADEEHWKQVQERVHKQDAKQERIILSKAIQEKIDKFAEQYLAKSYSS